MVSVTYNTVKNKSLQKNPETIANNSSNPHGWKNNKDG